MRLLAVDGPLLDHDGLVLCRDLAWRVAPGEVVALLSDSAAARAALVNFFLEHADCGAAVARSLSPDASVHRVMLEAAHPNVRRAGLSLIAAEENVKAGSFGAAAALGQAIEDWATAGGYALEPSWTRLRRLVGVEEGTLNVTEAWTLGALGACRSRTPVVVLDPPHILPSTLIHLLRAEVVASRATIFVLGANPPPIAEANTFVTVEPDGTWTHRGDAAGWLLEAQRRSTRRTRTLRRWEEEEARLREHVLVSKQRAAINSKNASRADAAESRWRRHLATQPSGAERSGPPDVFP